MTQPLRILLQTTLLPTDEDDWIIRRFSFLHNYLASLTDSQGNPLYKVTSRDRQPDAEGNDPLLSRLDRAEFDELWLFALDVGGGLSAQDQAGIAHFHQEGGGIFTTRDHQDMGISMYGLENLGIFHYFHTQQTDPDPSRCCVDDIHTTNISWPNYHSGSNGDYQIITAVEPIHPLLNNPDSPTGVIQFFPAHPHEGGVGVPSHISHATVVATGVSKVSQRPFNLVVAAERTTDAQGNQLGRIVAQSTFHHFVDYNWDTEQGCPGFVEEAPSDGMKKDPRAIADIHCYVKNLAAWLAPI
jgi:hypothetical protein